ncbi:hypothetical protein PT974_11962 [Cladobotryum mycophilum]|uniref:Spermine/spermidine synthase n=1 Tax=Cladobotryum mycophilum TaxID=491253 RepID=A0ABR0S6P1_9HYPO
MPQSKAQGSKKKGSLGEESTPERFEKELKDLASKARSDTGARRVLGQLVIHTKSTILLALLGIYSNVSQLALSPVYGSIPSTTYHSQALMIGCFIGWAGNLAFRQLLPIKPAKLLPLIAIYVPTIQFYLFGLSQTLRAQWGPAATEAATLVPLAIFTASSVADYLEGADFSLLPKFVAEAAPGLWSWWMLTTVERVSAKHLALHIGESFAYTRMGLELVLAAAYTVFAPSVYLVLTLPALIHTAMINTHVFTPAGTSALNGTMIDNQWMLLDRPFWGDWFDFRGENVTEPVYSVFVMLEAVRLVEREEPLVDSDANALVIGLGIGNLPSALVAHGIDTTVVEIDPAVYDFALQYFQLKENNPAVIEDAVAYTAQLVEEAEKTYDYIVHDVFTGGAEPVDLFTLEFFQNLHALLKPDGVVVINYAGDLVLPTPKIILETIQTVFPSCRIYRENPQDPEIFAKTGSDFTNMVIFCIKTETPLTFREPVEADFLNSRARYAYIRPQFEVQSQDFIADQSYGLLRRNETSKVMKWHKQSAAGHWTIMRTVLPASFWENW